MVHHHDTEPEWPEQPLPRGKSMSSSSLLADVRARLGWGSSTAQVPDAEKLAEAVL